MNSENKIMSFWEHVFEFRNRLLIVICSVVIFSVIGYNIFPFIVAILYRAIGENLYATEITEGFIIRIRSSIMIGVILSVPVFFLEISLFLTPALKKKEKVYLGLMLVITFMLFLIGVSFAYKAVLPISVRFLKSDAFFPSSVTRIISYNSFILFFFQFLLGFGLFFQFPVVLLFLLKIRIIDLPFLTKNFKLFIISIFIIAAILTPPDIVSQLMLAVPMTILYLICILAAKILRLG